MIRAIYFPGLTALPLFVASSNGLFAAHHVEVTTTPTANSRQLMTGMLNADYEIGQAAIDNLIAYQEMQAAPELDAVRDLVAIMASSSTNLDLVVQSAVQSYADLRGKTLAVDAPTTGFAFVLRKMLERGGLVEADYDLAAVGGDGARLDALRKGEVAGALLAGDFASQAVADGLHRLEASLDALGRYQGTCLFTRRGWAAEHRDELVRFLRAVRAAHDRIFDPSATAGSASILAARSAGMRAADAIAAVQHFRTDRGGLSRTGEFDIEGLKVVLALRNQYGRPKRDLDDPFRYIDPRYLSLAAGRADAPRTGNWHKALPT